VKPLPLTQLPGPAVVAAATPGGTGKELLLEETVQLGVWEPPEAPVAPVAQLAPMELMALMVLLPPVLLLPRRKAMEAPLLMATASGKAAVSQ